MHEQEARTLDDLIDRQWSGTLTAAELRTLAAFYDARALAASTYQEWRELRQTATAALNAAAYKESVAHQ